MPARLELRPCGGDLQGRLRRRPHRTCGAKTGSSAPSLPRTGRLALVVTLGDLVGHLERLEIRCRRCERRERIRLVRLIEEHGAEMALPELGRRLAADCPRATATDLSLRCCVYYPALVSQP